MERKNIVYIHNTYLTYLIIVVPEITQNRYKLYNKYTRKKDNTVGTKGTNTIINYGNIIVFV